jgi:hypothetical protein
VKVSINSFIFLQWVREVIGGQFIVIDDRGKPGMLRWPACSRVISSKMHVIARSGVPHAGNLGERLVHFVLKAKTVFSARLSPCGTSVHFLYGNGSHSYRVTVTPDRAMPPQA